MGTREDVPVCCVSVNVYPGSAARSMARITDDREGGKETGKK